MKSFALLSSLIILVVTGFPSNQKCRTLRFLQRDSSCGKTKYVKGFYRDQGTNNEAALLRDARCCSALPPDENNEQNCTFIRLRNELNNSNVWAECPFGMVIQGIKRSKQMYSWIYDIEGINCCHVKNVTPSYEDCYEKAQSVPRNYQGWVQCEGDYYVAGFFQGNRSCKDNSCKERLKCCNFVPRVCGRPLVGPVEGRLIMDNSITASSKQIPWAKMSDARIGGNDGWTPHHSDGLPYLQFDLEKLYLICGFEVLGCKGFNVTSYRVHVSPEKDYLNSWNTMKPEFYVPDVEEKRAYRQASVRKLGRYVIIFPRGKDPWTRISCVEVEIYGEPYFKILQDVFFMHNEIAMSYKKGRITKFVGNDIVVEEYKNPYNLTTRISDGLLHYVKVVPSRISWMREVSPETCVIGPNPVKGEKDFLSGRIEEVGNQCRVVYFARHLGFLTGRFKKEQLQVVYGAWCKTNTSVYIKNGEGLNSMRCRGDIVQIDTQFTIQSTELGALRRFSFDEITSENYFSQSGVRYPEYLKSGDVLLFEGADYCLRVGSFKSYDPNRRFISLKLPSSNITFERSSHDVRVPARPPKNFRPCDEREKTCWKSRIPFGGVTRFKCSGIYCVEEDECVTGMANCADVVACNDTLYGYNCVCPPSTYTHGDARKIPCTDVDECKDWKNCIITFSDSGDDHPGVCVNFHGGYNCECVPGYLKLTGGVGWAYCYKMPQECDRKPCYPYSNVACRNVPGSYKCECQRGYQGHYKDCKDEDECSSGRHQCSPHANCTNTMGSYVCKCKLGFTGDGRLCTESLRCHRRWKGRDCHPTLAKCVDVLDGYKCECIVGYQGDGKTCKVTDECELGIHECHQLATCINTEKSYECSCRKGYEGNGFTCKDVDECANNQNDCGFRKDGTECFNTNGSYLCACREGFTGDGKTCTNIDECKTGAHDCVENAICTDRKGNFSCKCTSGFSGNATEKCIDIDECLSSDGNKCPKNATCINNHGSYECRCKKGFDGDGFNCQDIDECLNKKACSSIANTTCKNTPGSFNCECNQGFEGDDPNKNCSDVDECLNGACEYNGQTCINSLGSFECKCTEGFSQVNSPGEDMCKGSKPEAISSTSTKTGKVWIFSVTMATLSLFTAMF
ncbi:PREDICTED: uncharacterized protein LOC107337270 isoform X3 [Acropora digitifera]|uniref:uncharacterized protein LOC107337270 isoform X3 n=1 Tax=Acropora digitifera TaxID=70779 RepID=UPI00077AD5C0|nr:PREDICTED: uncharacterized protein LOC107337270 isoform X3 [Acropora digitifera]